jgi:hypothetical protein
LALAFYVILHGLWVGNPGQSWPGRYLCAGMPLMCVFITAWCFGGTRGRVWRRWLFLLLALPGALFSAGIVWRGWFDINNVNADFTPNFYHQLFLPFWRATQSQFPHGGELIGYLVVAAAVLGLGFEIRAWLAEKRS